MYVIILVPYQWRKKSGENVFHPHKLYLGFKVPSEWVTYKGYLIFKRGAYKDILKGSLNKGFLI